MKKQESRRAEGGREGWQNGTLALHGRGREEGRRSGFSIFQPSSPPPYLTGETASLVPPFPSVPPLRGGEGSSNSFPPSWKPPYYYCSPPCHAIDGFCSQRPRSGKFVVLSLLPFPLLPSKHSAWRCGQKSKKGGFREGIFFSSFSGPTTTTLPLRRQGGIFEVAPFHPLHSIGVGVGKALFMSPPPLSPPSTAEWHMWPSSPLYGTEEAGSFSLVDL